MGLAEGLCLQTLARGELIPRYTLTSNTHAPAHFKLSHKNKRKLSISVARSYPYYLLLYGDRLDTIQADDRQHCGIFHEGLGLFRADTGGFEVPLSIYIYIYTYIYPRIFNSHSVQDIEINDIPDYQVRNKIHRDPKSLLVLLKGYLDAYQNKRWILRVQDIELNDIPDYQVRSRQAHEGR